MTFRKFGYWWFTYKKKTYGPYPTETMAQLVLANMHKKTVPV
jgi:hypothetical protein